MRLILDGILNKAVRWQAAYRFLLECPKAIGMTVLVGPFVRQEARGIYGWVTISESHMTVHSQGSNCRINILSCKGFDQEKAKALAENHFETEFKITTSIDSLATALSTPKQ